MGSYSGGDFKGESFSPAIEGLIIGGGGGGEGGFISEFHNTKNTHCWKAEITNKNHHKIKSCSFGDNCQIPRDLEF